MKADNEDLDKLMISMVRSANTDPKMTLPDKIAIMKAAMAYEDLKLKQAKGKNPFGKGFDQPGGDND